MISPLELLREALRATETKEWIKGALAKDNTGRYVYAGWIDEHGRLEYGKDDKPIDGLALVAAHDSQSFDPVECDAVVGCCAIGYVDFAQVCMALLIDGTRPELLKVRELTISHLERAVWQDESVRARVIESLDEENKGWKEDVDDIDNSDLMSIALSDAGYEGLVPYYNDHIATSVDQIRDLYRLAIELATREEGA